MKNFACFKSLLHEIHNLMCTDRFQCCINVTFITNFLSKQYFTLKSTRCLPGEQSGAFVRGLFLLVLHLGDARAELHGSLGQDG